MTQFYWFLGHEQFQPEELVNQAKLVEAAGFDGVMVSEHFHPWVDDIGTGGFAFATLGAIAQTTSQIKLMTAVTTPLFRYHPAVVAQAAATIDRLSGGRFELGIGTGESINETPLGYDWPGYKERAGRLKEAIEIMRRLLDGEKLSFEGEYYQTRDAKLYSPSTSQVPIYMAAGGPKSAVLAGEKTDGLIVSVKDPAETLEQAVLPAKQAAGGKEFKIIASRWTVVAESDDEAWEALGAWRGLRAPSRPTAHDPAELRREADALDSSEILNRYGRAKSAPELIDVYSPLITELGADIIGIQATAIDQDTLINNVGKQVLPKLRTLEKEGK